MDFDIFRCIPQEQRSFGLGIQWIIARCLGKKSYYYHVLSGVSLPHRSLVGVGRCVVIVLSAVMNVAKLSVLLPPNSLSNLV